MLVAIDLAVDFGQALGTPAVGVPGGSAEVTFVLDPTLSVLESWSVEMTPKSGRIGDSDSLELVYGIYNLSERCLGVGPLGFWKGMPPERREKVGLTPQTFAWSPAKIRYRGWFLNDEDLLMEFGKSGEPHHVDYLFYAQVIDYSMAERISKALLRLGGKVEQGGDSAATLARVREIVDPAKVEAAAEKCKRVGAAGDLRSVPEWWRSWTRVYFSVQRQCMGALRRAAAAMAWDRPDEAAGHIEQSPEIRTPLARD